MIATKPVVLLLSAGFSRRFGADKTLYPFPTAAPMAISTLRQITAVIDAEQVYVAVRPDQHTLRRLLTDEGINCIDAPHASLGLSGSLGDAVRATPLATGWLIALADMPTIQAKTYLMLYRLLEEGEFHALYAPSYQGKRGHPVAFGAAWKNALLKLCGDNGARPLLQNHANQLTLVPCEDAGVLVDIDTLKFHC